MNTARRLFVMIATTAPTTVATDSWPPAHARARPRCTNWR